MSGFTTTPNYALFKPTPGLDNDAWGDHLNANADTLDTLIKTFLPLSGGTVTGDLTVTGNTTFAAVTASGRITSAGLTSTASIVGQTGITAGTNSATTGGTFIANAAAGNQRYIQFMSAGSNRMRFGVDNVAESVGTNVGSNPFLNVYDDAGTNPATAWSVNRATAQSSMPSLKLGKTFTFTGLTTPDLDFAPLNIYSGFAGVTDKVAGHWPVYHSITIASDSVDVGTTNQRIGLKGTHRYGNAGYTGGASGIMWSMVQNGPINNAESIQAAVFGGSASYSSGGTDVWAGAKGRIYGLSLYSTLFSGATNYAGLAGCELDYTVQAGSSARSIMGFYVVRLDTHAYSAPIWESDGAIAVGTAALSNNAKYGFSIGVNNGFWPIDQANGRLIGTPFTVNPPGNLSPMMAAHGLDFNPVDLTGTFLRGRGFSVLGSGQSLPAGAVQVGNAYLSSTTTAAALDVVGSTATGAVIASGGTNLYVGVFLIHDATGTLLTVDSVTGGVATAVTLIAKTGYAITPPANPVTFRVSSPAPGIFAAAPTAPTINLTWTAANSLAIQPTAGGKLGFNGATPIVKQTGVAVTIAAVHAALVNLGLIAA